jgi:hypothetical protein
MADSTLGHADERGLAISKCPTPGITTTRTGSPARLAASAYASTSGRGETQAFCLR